METPNPYALAILFALQRKRTYDGTVDPQTIERRRARNRVARRSRRVNRERGVTQ